MAPLYVPTKRRLAAYDPFFAQGNAEACICSVGKHLVHAQAPACGSASWEGAADKSPMMDIVDSWLEDAGALQHAIICHDPPCHGSASYPSALAYEKHYDQAHRNVCSICGAVLPSAHWLDLHIQEFHDAFFSARVARGDKVFQCFLPSCSRTFARPHKRKQHMIDKHHFARSFSWQLVRDGLQPRSRRQRSKKPSDSMDVDQLAAAFQRSVSFGRRNRPPASRWHN
ncbi:hypothetical protein LPJ78_003203 [Coemansia sp. RSA 989]|nr:hypothetical protein BX667DRAFT_405662 [Coemansia mojavensis]KAJ1739850.1 hypothetical protein LPJ68_004298 [Coemansia sp. RSA 1086]KAJ1750508.1 hypothetical protein LPJ79_002850 [Coemansia sp. RSA 1821]KAJ1864703.1 hypothetical protein LPJ78_003203 [Coemansia sp. RSA 989]KAJ1872200.1 hypothetical protein LPJ55_003296 [Coemansia sp. RSA 990]KAJ2674529.1 hypothetical protein IWW42_001699 [Coemansia sp. RSA 1085]